MKLRPPDLPSQLIDVTDFAALLRRDETLSELRVAEADASGIRLKSAVLQESQISNSSLSQVRIEKLHIRDCIVDRCDLTASVLADSSWHSTVVRSSRCSGIQLQTSLIKDVHFKNCKLDMANFRFSKLENVIFESCAIAEIDFYHASLKRVAFVDCDIDRVEFSDSTLVEVDLTRSRIMSVKGIRGLKGACISSEQLIVLAPYFAQEIGLIIKDQRRCLLY